MEPKHLHLLFHVIIWNCPIKLHADIPACLTQEWISSLLCCPCLLALEEAFEPEARLRFVCLAGDTYVFLHQNKQTDWRSNLLIEGSAELITSVARKKRKKLLQIWPPCKKLTFAILYPLACGNNFVGGPHSKTHPCLWSIVSVEQWNHPWGLCHVPWMLGYI